MAKVQVTMTVHTIDLFIDVKNGRITATPDRLEVKGGDYVQWKRSGDTDVPFIINFKDYGNGKKNGKGKESPFWCAVLTDDAATEPQLTRWGGPFNYSVRVISHPPLFLDPAVVVDPPTYP